MGEIVAFLFYGAIAAPIVLILYLLITLCQFVWNAFDDD